MRVIAGIYRGRVLKSPPTIKVRPTSDRLRETLFNVIAPRIEGVRFLDLCSGSGAVGIEAISRGANHATLVDHSRKLCVLIDQNLAALNIPPDKAEVVNKDALEFLREAERFKNGSWDLIYYDPPYQTDYSPVLGFLGNAASVLNADALVIAEHHHKHSLLDSYGDLHRKRILKQGETVLSFYQLRR